MLQLLVVQKKTKNLLLIFSLLLFFFSSFNLLAQNSESEYQAARKLYYQLINQKLNKVPRVKWLDVINSFEQIIKKYPSSKRKIDAQYTIGLLFKNLAAHSNRQKDLDLAIDSFQKVALAVDKNDLADDALFHVAEIYRAWKKDKVSAYLAYKRVYQLYPKGDMAAKARKKAKILEKEVVSNKGIKKTDTYATVEKIKFYSKPSYTRVIVQLDRPAPYSKVFKLPRDKRHHQPERLYFDITNTRKGKSVSRSIKIADGLLRHVRTGQFKDNTTRIVMDIESIDDYQIVSFNEPFRIIVDVRGHNGKQKVPTPTTRQLQNEIDSEVEKLIAKQRHLIKKIVIDPGHGGSDPGAKGRHGLKEKNVVLDIGKRLAKKLRQRGFEVYLTRETDRFLSLEERTVIANEKRADLFISVHANASPKRRARGVSTFVFNNSDDEESIRVAARENDTSYGADLNSESYLKMTLASLRKDQQTNISRDLADKIQKGIIHRLKKKYRHVKNLGIREAYFYVLLGAQMPCILVETSFISNPTEERRLKSSRYRDLLALGIADGVQGFIKERQVALRRSRLKK